MMPAWYVIYNPISGGGKSIKRLHYIISLFKKYELKVEIVATKYPHHEKELVQLAIEKGYNHFICIGGDGTIHHMMNGIMKQHIINSNTIKLAVIPSGTGNDWVKNYNIPSHPEKVIQIISRCKSIYQDIGSINLAKNNKVLYFNNSAGIGFDAFTVKKISFYKKFGLLAYLFAGISSLRTYTSSDLTVEFNKTKKDSSIFMISIGICKYSGGGMQLTDYKNKQKGSFNITIIEAIKFIKVMRSIHKLYNGKIKKIKEVNCYQSPEVFISNNESCYIQADGELIGNGTASFTLIPRAIQFIVP